MPPKRMTAAAERLPVGNGRSKKRLVDDCNPNSGPEMNTRLDPFAFLNADVLNLMMYHFSPPDLVRCESVSKIWRDAIRSWTISFGFRVNFPDIIWNRQGASDDAVWENFRVHARQQNGLQSGKASSIQKIPKYFGVIVAGNFLAAHTNEPFVIWHDLAAPGSGVVNPKKIPFKKFWEGEIEPANLEMNRDGLLLLRIQEESGVRARSIVYSPPDNKTVWQQDHRHYDREQPPLEDLWPILIGRSVLHCTRRDLNHNEFGLVGIDFRSSKSTIIYESSAVSLGDWSHNGAHQARSLIDEPHELLILYGTKDHLGNPIRVSILDGANGQLIFHFDMDPSHYFSTCPTLTCPSINQFSILSGTTIIGPNHTVECWQDHENPVRSLQIVQRFSFALSEPDNNSFDIIRLGADVIFSPRAGHEFTIQPFAKVAVTMKHNSTISTHPLVETEETYLIQMAKAALEEAFPPPSAPPTLRRCFIFGEHGTKISRRPSSSTQASLATVPNMRMRRVNGFVDTGRLLAAAWEGYFLFDF